MGKGTKESLVPDEVANKPKVAPPKHAPSPKHKDKVGSEDTLDTLPKHMNGLYKAALAIEEEKRDSKTSSHELANQVREIRKAIKMSRKNNMSTSCSVNVLDLRSVGAILTFVELANTTQYIKKVGASVFFARLGNMIEMIRQHGPSVASKHKHTEDKEKVKQEADVPMRAEEDAPDLDVAMSKVDAKKGKGRGSKAGSSDSAAPSTENLQEEEAKRKKKPEEPKEEEDARPAEKKKNKKKKKKSPKVADVAASSSTQEEAKPVPPAPQPASAASVDPKTAACDSLLRTHPKLRKIVLKTKLGCVLRQKDQGPYQSSASSLAFYKDTLVQAADLTHGDLRVLIKLAVETQTPELGLALVLDSRAKADELVNDLDAAWASTLMELAHLTNNMDLVRAVVKRAVRDADNKIDGEVCGAICDVCQQHNMLPDVMAAVSESLPEQSDSEEDEE